MARMLKWLGLATLSFSLTGTLVGCVPQEKYNAKVLENEALKESNNNAEQEASAAKAEAQAAKSQLSKLSDQVTTDSALRTNLEKQNEELAAAKSAAETRANDLANQPPTVIEHERVISTGGGSALPAPLTSALNDFAAANPGLVDFDSSRGVVKFKSDVTFATGSAELTPEAKTVIDKFATILNSPAAGEYELMVAGHTDNVPVNNPETIRHGHLNNWYLSSHRAIAVANELASQSVSKGRLAVVGYADQRPVADNGTSGGRKLNRRVEVLILPTKRSAPAITAGAGGAPAPRHAAVRHADFNKDTGVTSVDRGPILNK